MGIGIKITGTDSMLKELKNDLTREAVRAGKKRRKIAKKALELIAEITPVWSGRTQASIRLTEGRPSSSIAGGGKGERGTNFMPLGVGAERNSNIERVVSQITNLKVIKSYKDEIPPFFITASSKAVDLGVFEGKVPYNPKHNLHPRVPEDALDIIASILRSM